MFEARSDHTSSVDGGSASNHHALHDVDTRPNFRPCLVHVCESAQDWPSFAGPAGQRVVDGPPPRATWNVSTSANVAWRTAIAGLGHSSPIVSGDHHLTTAVSDVAASRSLTLGDVDQAGIDPAKDMVPHRWQLMALDRLSGKVLWTRSVHQGFPGSSGTSRQVTHRRRRPQTARLSLPCSAPKGSLRSIRLAKSCGDGISGLCPWVC